MTTQEIATRLVSLCRQGEFETATKELYSPDIVSIEPFETPDFEKEARGIEAVEAKGKKFVSMTEAVHAITVSDPLVTNNVIAFILGMDITMKGRDRQKWSELCVYQVKEGKIISEQFFM